MKPFLRPLVLATTLALAVPLLTAQSAAAAPADDLILRYSLDETTGLMQKVIPTLESVAPQKVPVAAPAIAVTASASTRCISGKVVLSVLVTNPNAFPVKVVIGSTYGSKTIAEVAAGKSATHSFTTREASIPAGQATATATAFVAGKPATASATAPYSAASCG
ncbi:hypothetical protein GRS96_00925 [Rathayibacter sp. VKM Ac-2803]|uniref:hypothetical protein n=1 Tax=Rathayibacter sp. VKM Ac-2803 TaxID=2609256 RepID=UPI001359FDD0|nr:hypothetical protein [Rathayibacter sp. VKM Ac-2803]MWV47834.1 hypothetical protein [Rathayibacter sp. VKM Ac-2803]